MKLGDIDAVFAVCYTGNRERHYRLIKELKRVGIGDVNVIWSYPSPYRKFVLDRIPHIPCLDQKPGYWGATIAHYRAIKTACHLEMRQILIVEDDCRFLKDVDKVWSSLELAPENADVILLDHVEEKQCRPIPDNKMYFECDKSYSTGCYILSRKAMARYIDMYESPVSGKYKKPIMRACDHFTDVKYLGGDVHICCANPRLAIQCDCGDVTNTGGNVIHDCYVKAGLDFEAYQGW